MSKFFGPSSHRDTSAEEQCWFLQMLESPSSGGHWHTFGSTDPKDLVFELIPISHSLEFAGRCVPCCIL